MPLKVTSREKEPGVLVFMPDGSLDTNTYMVLEEKVDTILEGTPKAIVFDMENLKYISSMGVRVIIKTRKALKKHDGNLVLMNLQPQIKKVLEIIQALPSEQIFSSVEELDRYLDRMQKKITDD